jgi:predicted Fe-Mo cluster-binding NifX family protein
MAPVNYLAEQGVTALIAGGMGLRPLMGFNQVGIKVFFGNGVQTVGEAVQAFAADKLPQFSQENTCGGGGHGVQL